MDFINSCLNLVAPPFTFFTLLFFLPPWLFFKFCLRILGYIFTEDVAGKVVLITGASSGIGEHLAYEYASRGACLALAARRENRLREVADRCLRIGSPDVVTQRVDVAKANDCRHFIDRAANHFGRLDHLVNNAGITQVSMLEDIDDVTNMRPIMDINFWGSVYTTRFAVPHLRNTGGRIIVLSSPASSLPTPRMSLYNASKAAMVQFFETLRVEFGSDIKITIATPGFVESELTQGKFLSEGGEIVVDPEMRDVQINIAPVERVEACARAIVNGACRGERYVIEPFWIRMIYLWKMFWPEVVEWIQRLMVMTTVGDSPKDAVGKKILDYTGAQKVLYPESIQAPVQTKTE